MIGEQLKFLRSEKGLTQKDLAEYLKISTSAYGFYEQGKREPDMETLIKLAAFFNVSSDFLLGRTNIKNYSESTVALHREDGYEDDLPEEARKEIEEFKEFIRHKYGKK
ncbi:helix-turn-helix transcriptional regulator [Clostridium sp. 19966]|uniref:helix-turn-helix domain-containing protein n=1 Tax=Clostridium sp. 19966 TaxID=2768166 RepID=UPI0028DD881E|nr:helix-turn-helix transcriptional regulator [Clostridium sp. 19966]MDT8717631.1 helix-turn-helix transcriptional regulator [Clostridium sp. 19966]